MIITIWNETNSSEVFLFVFSHSFKDKFKGLLQCFKFRLLFFINKTNENTIQIRNVKWLINFNFCNIWSLLNFLQKCLLILKNNFSLFIFKEYVIIEDLFTIIPTLVIVAIVMNTIVIHVMILLVSLIIFVVWAIASRATLIAALTSLAILTFLNISKHKVIIIVLH